MPRSWGQVGIGREGILFSATAREGLGVGWSRFDRQRIVCLGPLTDESLVKRAGKRAESGVQRKVRNQTTPRTEDVAH